jgi:hypothetical protein
MILIFLASIFILFASLSLFIYFRMKNIGIFKLPDYLVTKTSRIKFEWYCITETILNSIFYKENGDQKEMIVNFRKLGKVRIIGRDEVGRIAIKIVFSPLDYCVVLIYPYNGWIVENNFVVGKSEKYFEKFNLSWYFGGSPDDVKTAAQRTPADNLLIKL